MICVWSRVVSYTGAWRHSNLNGKYLENKQASNGVQWVTFRRKISLRGLNFRKNITSLEVDWYFGTVGDWLINPLTAVPAVPAETSRRRLYCWNWIGLRDSRRLLALGIWPGVQHKRRRWYVFGAVLCHTLVPGGTVIWMESIWKISKHQMEFNESHFVGRFRSEVLILERISLHLKWIDILGQWVID